MSFKQMIRVKFFVLLAATWLVLAPLHCDAIGSPGKEIPIGAIRWDVWFADSSERTVLELPEWSDRIPFFARKGSDGHLLLDGDKEHVLAAETAYARSVGVDYSIFGFYPDTLWPGAWNQRHGIRAE